MHLPPLVPTGQLPEKLGTPHGVEEAGKPRLQKGPVRPVKAGNGHILRERLRDGPAHVEHAAHHAHAGAFPEHGRHPLAAVAADHRPAAAHELERKAADAAQYPEFRRIVERVVLHEGTGARPGPAPNIDGPGGGTVPGRVPGVAAHGDGPARVQPAHVGGRGAVHHDLGPVKAHGAHALAGVGHMEAQRPAFAVPQRAADVVLAGSRDLEIRLAAVHRLFYGKEQVLRGHAPRLVQGVYPEHGPPPSRHNGCRACPRRPGPW